MGLAALAAQEAETFRESRVDFVEVDRADGFHGAEFVEDAPDGLRALQRLAGKRGQAVEPFSPKGGFGKGVEFGDEWEREAGEGLEALNLALGEFGAGGVLAFEGGMLEAELVFEAPESAFPAGAATDDGGVDDEAFPEDGGDDMIRLDWLRRGGGAIAGREEAGEELVVGWQGSNRLGEVLGGGYLTEREVLGKAGSGATFTGAGEEGEKGTSGGVGAGDAAGKPGGDFGAAKGFFEQGLVAFGAAEKDGDLIERDAGLADAAGNFHTFEAFAGGGEEVDRGIWRSLSGSSEQGPGDVVEGGGGRVRLRFEVERGGEGVLVAGEDKGQDCGGVGGDLGEEIAVGF